MKDYYEDSLGNKAYVLAFYDGGKLHMDYGAYERFGTSPIRISYWKEISDPKALNFGQGNTVVDIYFSEMARMRSMARAAWDLEKEIHKHLEQIAKENQVNKYEEELKELHSVYTAAVDQLEGRVASQLQGLVAYNKRFNELYDELNETKDKLIALESKMPSLRETKDECDCEEEDDE